MGDAERSTSDTCRAGRRPGNGTGSPTGERAERVDRSRARTGLLSLLALLSFAGYWAIVGMSLNPRLKIVFDVRGARYGGPLVWPSRWLGLANLSDDGRTWLFFSIVVAVTAMWMVAMWLVRHDPRRSTSLLIAGAFLAFALLFVFGPPFLSRDVFSYSFHGRAMSVYRENPYLLVPSLRSHDVFYPLIGWNNNASVYGPVFNYLSCVITKVAGENVAASVLLFKLVAFFSFAACLPLVHNLTRRLKPGSENMALLTCAWCPVLVTHVLGGGHNDILMIALVLAGYLLYRKGYLLTGLVVVLLGALVKATAALALAPLFVLYVRDTSGATLKRFLKGAAVLGGAALALYAPFFDGTRIFDTARRMSGFYSASSVPRLVSFAYERLLMRGGMPAHRAEDLANARVQLLFLALLVVIGVVLLLRVRDYRTTVASAAGLFLVWLLTTSYVLPWYVAAGLMLACLLGWNLTTATMVGISAVFGLYRIPVPQADAFTRAGPNLYMSVPFLVMLVIWLAIPTSGWLLNRRRAPDDPAPAMSLEES